MNTKNLFALAVVATVTVAQPEPEYEFPEKWSEDPECINDPSGIDWTASGEKCPDRPRNKNVKQVKNKVPSM